MAELDDEEDGIEESEGLPEFVRRERDSSGKTRFDLRLQGISDLANLTVDARACWTQIGPAPLRIDHDQDKQGTGPNAGLVADLAIDPGGASDTAIYVASGYGGVWKSTTGGTDWAPTMEALPSLLVGAVAIDPVDHSIIYAGIGTVEGDHFAGAGLFKSIDGAATWFVADGGLSATLFANLDVNYIVCPQGDMLFVGTSGGLYYSVDGGLNFGANHPAHNDGKPIQFPGVHPVANVNVSSLRQDTTSPDTGVWVALSGVGLFRITINADKSLTVGANLFTSPGAPGPGLFTDILLAQGRGNTGAPRPDQTYYASVQFTNPAGVASFVGLYKSTDAGVSWTQPANPAAPGGATGLAARLGTRDGLQSDYAFTLGVDPQDANRVFAGFRQLWRSADANCSFTEQTACSANQVHFDHHALVFSPSTHWGGAPAPTRIYVGTDGGLARSDDGGTAWTNLNAGVATNLFYGIDIGRGSAANNEYTYGGCQDTGTEGHRPADAAGEWHSGRDGDGGPVAVDPADPTIVYGFLNEFLMKSMDSGGTWLRSRTKTATITGATNASPIVITAVAHGFSDGDPVAIAGVNGNVDANGQWVITAAAGDPNHFSLRGSIGHTPYANGGIATLLPRADLPVTGATHATPILVTAAGHPFINGDRVSISGVGGNNAANGDFLVTRVDRNHFSLNGIAGDGDFNSAGTVIGPGIGRGLPNPDSEFVLRRVALAPNGANPATTVFVSQGATLFRSDDGGLTFSPIAAIPVGAGAADITALTCFDATHLWVGLANGSVHLSVDNGAHWDPAGFNPHPGPAREVAAIAVDPANPARVAIALVGFAEANPKFSTKHCFLSTDNGQSWADASGTDGNAAGNLPDLPLHDVVFDSSVAPSALIVATDGAVLRSEDNGTNWRVMNVGLPRVSCLSLAIDNGATPRVLRVGTYGRSAYELTRPAGAAFVFDGNLGFGAMSTGQTATSTVTVYNPGNAALTINSFSRVSGVADFALQGAPSFPLTIDPHGSQAFTVTFSPGAAGNRVAGFEIASSDPAASPFQVFASGQGIATAGVPRLAVRANLSFGETNGGQTRSLPIEIANSGLGPLTITGFARASGSSDFQLSPAPTLPLTLAPGASQTANVTFAPDSNGAIGAQFTIDSDDRGQPNQHRVVAAKGTGVSVGSNTLKIVLFIIGIAVITGLVVGSAIAHASKK